MRAVVKNVAKYFPTAIISGRSRDKVIDMPLFAFINVNVNVMLFLNSWKFGFFCIPNVVGVFVLIISCSYLCRSMSL